MSVFGRNGKNQFRWNPAHGYHELEFAANWAEPENQAELVPGPEPDKIKIKKNFFSKNQIHQYA